MDVAVIGGGVTGCSCALTLAQSAACACACTRRARSRAGRAAETAASRSAARRCPTTGARDPRPDTRALALAADRTRARADRSCSRATRSAASAACASQATRPRRDALGRRGSRRCARTASRVEWLDELPAPLGGLYAAAFVNPGDGALQPARWVRRLAAQAAEAGAEIAEGHDASTQPTSSVGRRRARGRRAHGCVLPELAGRGSAGPRAGARRPSRSPSGSSTGRTTRATASTTGSSCRTAGWCRRQARRRASRPRTPRSRRRRRRSRANSRHSSPSCRGPAPRITHRWAGIWARRRTDCRSPAGCRENGIWVAGGYSGHGNVLGFACGDLVARAILGESPPELELFDPTASSARARASPERQPAAGFERGDRDREILDRKPVESKSVISSSDRCVPARRRRGPRRAPSRRRAEQTRPRRRARAPRRGSPAPSRRRRPVRRASSAAAISALPGPSAPIRLTCWPGRSEPSPKSTSCPGVTVTTRSAASASSREPATLGAELVGDRAAPARRRGPRSRRVAAACEERAHRRAPVHARADHGRRAARPRGRASRRRAPPRRPCAAPSPQPRRAPPRARPSRAFETSTTPLTVGSPRAGLPGKRA